MQFKNYDSEADFLEEARSFANSLENCAGEIDRNGEFPPNFTTELAMRRFLAFDKLNDSAPPVDSKTRRKLVVKVIHELSRVSASTAKKILDQNLGQVDLFREFASRELQISYLPKIQSGCLSMAFLMTEPQTGSVLSRFNCTAKKARGGYLINGVKDWITGARDRLLFLVVVKYEADSNQFGLLLVDRSLDDQIDQSICISDKKKTLGLRGLDECRVEFIDTFVPDSHTIIPFSESAIKKIMEHYNLKRCGQATIANGLSKSALNISYNYLKERHPGKGGGLAFQDAEFTCAYMYSLIQASELLTEWAVEEILNGDKTGVMSSMAKLFATESAVRITNSAIQLCGANATSQDLPLERFMRDAIMLKIAGGTSEIQKRVIARHLPYLLKSNESWHNIQTGFEKQLVKDF